MDHNQLAALMGITPEALKALIGRLPKQLTRRNGTPIAALALRATLPNDGRRFGGKPFWRTRRLQSSIDTWLARSAKGHAKLDHVPATPDEQRIAGAIIKRARRSHVLQLRGHL